MFLIWTVFIFFTGLSIGSFLNVCIWRLPRGESIVSPPSHCPGCNHDIRWYENIPLLSWLALRGRCSACGNPISPRYFCVELLTGLMFLAVWFRVAGFHTLPYGIAIPRLVSYLIIVLLIILTAFIDWDHRIIPNKITYPAIFAGLITAFLSPKLWPLSNGSPLAALSLSCASVAAASIILAFFAIAGKKIFKKDALGWGDVKYVAAVAAILGPRAAFFTLLAGSIIGATAGIILIAMKKGNLKSGIPFGPPLALSTFIWILYGREIFGAYMRFTASLAEKLGT